MLLPGRTASGAVAVPPQREQGFSLIEIMTVVALLTVIVIGLMATFSTTQRAWRVSMTQTDVLEAGRMATDLIRRDFGSIAASGLRGVTNFNVQPGFFAPPLSQNFPQTPAPPAPGSEVRIDIKQEVFFLTRENKLWRGIGYRVDSALDPDLLQSGIGTLYRFEWPPMTNSPANANAIFQVSRESAVTNAFWTPIIDGVVHFAVRTYDVNGYLISSSLSTNIVVGLPQLPDAWPATFRSNAVPAYVDVEIGILETRATERALAMPNVAIRGQYLTNQLGHVHIFRERIAVRNVDPAAYR